MTKIYLVKGKFYSNNDGNVVSVNFQVFTNKKLAKVYREYKEITKQRWLDRYDDVLYEIEEFEISKYDYTDLLLKKQMEKLPY